jgi:hypothetical protein
MAGGESEAIHETSRRTVLRNALLVGVGAAAAGITSLSRTGTARAASSNKIAYGAMHSIYPDWVANAPSPDGKNSERRYFDSIPADWTAAACYSNYVTMSIRPNPDDLLNNNTVPDNGSGYTTLDGQIKHLLSTCPDHAELTCWHEAQSDNPIGYPSYITATSIRAIHAHVQNLCSNTPDADGGRVKYGCILVGPVKANANWLGTKLDWYGIDIYDGPAFQYTSGSENGELNQSLITGRMDENLSYWQAASTTGTVSVRITETNSNEDNHRKNWMLYLSQWMAANNGYRIITFWGGPDSGTWPPSQTVLDYYVTLQGEYGA